MKKIYNAPIMKVAILDTANVLMNTSDLSDTPLNGGTKDQYDETGGSGLARENNNLWDNEW